MCYLILIIACEIDAIISLLQEKQNKVIERSCNFPAVIIIEGIRTQTWAVGLKSPLVTVVLIGLFTLVVRIDSVYHILEAYLEPLKLKKSQEKIFNNSVCFM